jgi:hypothetical protein
MLNEEETRLRAVVTDCHGLSLDASYALTSAVYGVANYLKLAEKDAVARAAYNAARLALRAYRGSRTENAHGAGGFK